MICPSFIPASRRLFRWVVRRWLTRGKQQPKRFHWFTGMWRLNASFLMPIDAKGGLQRLLISRASFLCEEKGCSPSRPNSRGPCLAQKQVVFNQPGSNTICRTCQTCSLSVQVHVGLCSKSQRLPGATFEESLCALKQMRNRQRSPFLSFFENVFVLRVSNGQSSLGS